MREKIRLMLVLQVAALTAGLSAAQDVQPIQAAPAGAESALQALRRSADGAVDAAAVPTLEAAAVEKPGLPADLKALSGGRLLGALHELTGRNYREHGYNEAHQYMFSTADNVVRGGWRGVADAYSGVFVPGTSSDSGQYREQGDQNGDGFVDSDGMNIEHVWPQSFFGKQLPMRSDLHHLLPTFDHPNSERSNYPFGVVHCPCEYQNNGGAKLSHGVFEPPNAAKGRVARALLYFYTRYYDRDITGGGYGPEFWDDNLGVILDWNRTFPPTREEMRRNDLVERFQGNRNPYVDDSGLADRVGVEGFRRASRPAPGGRR